MASLGTQSTNGGKTWATSLHPRGIDRVRLCRSHTEDVALRFTTAHIKEYALSAYYKLMVILAVLFRVI